MMGAYSMVQLLGSRLGSGTTFTGTSAIFSKSALFENWPTGF